MRTLGAAAARVWLELLFWLSATAPAVPRLIGPVAVFCAWLASPALRAGTLANAGRILGAKASARDRRRLGRRVTASFYDAVVEFGRNRRRTTDQILASIESVEGLEEYEQARTLGRGAILVTAHLGSFETAVASLRQREPRVHLVFRRDRVPRFERLRSEQRRRLGVLEVAVDDGLSAWFTLRDALRANDVVLFQGDRTMPGQRGRTVPFLHGHIEIPDGPVRLAEMTGSPVIPAFAILTSGRGVRILLGRPMLVGPHGPDAVSADEALRRVAASIAQVVNRYPEQWLVLEKAWVEDRGEDRG